MKLSDLNLLIWDIDGVLLYVRESYRRSIADTVQFYFSDLLGLKLGKRLMTEEETQHFKLVEGFNDDWKLTYAAVLCFLCKLVNESGFDEKKDYSGKDLEGRVRILKELGKAFDGNYNLSIDLEKITFDMKENGAGLISAEKTFKDFFGERVVEVAKTFWFKDVIKRIFQEMYLGEELFRKKTGEKPIFLSVPGLIREEKPLVSSETMEKLAKKYGMNAATGRDRFEAEYSLKIAGYSKYLPSKLLVCSEDVSHGKPDPEPLLKSKERAVKEYGLGKGARAAYIGDSVDDIRAAKSAGFYSVGCLSALPDSESRKVMKKEFSNLKCDLVIETADELMSHL